MQERDAGGDDREPTVDAEELEAEWERSLDAADHAVDASRGAGALPRADLAAESARIADERRWLSGIRGALRRLVPGRRGDEPS